MRTTILIAAMALWLLAAACGTDGSPRVDAPGMEPEESTGSKEQVADTRGRDSSPVNTTDRKVRSAAPAGLGVPLYPGAKTAEADRRAPAGAEELAARQGLITSLFFTTDAIAEVAAFYRRNLENGAPRMYEMDLPSGRMVNIMLRGGGKDTNIVLSEPREKPGTLIRITRVAE